MRVGERLKLTSIELDVIHNLEQLADGVDKHMAHDNSGVPDARVIDISCHQYRGSRLVLEVLLDRDGRTELAGCILERLGSVDRILITGVRRLGGRNIWQSDGQAIEACRCTEMCRGHAPNENLDRVIHVNCGTP